MTVSINNQQQSSQKTNTRRPNFFIVGAPKSGTSSLYRYLKQHPDIFMSTPKEATYFCTDLKSPKFSTEQYLNLFQNREEKICGEATTWYLFSEVAAQKIYEFNSEAKILIMLREPVSLLYSLHSQNIFSLQEDIKDFETALEVETDRKIGVNLPKILEKPPVSAYSYTKVVEFTEQVERYFNIFGRDQVKVVIFDDFIKNTDVIYREVLEFLMVDSNYQPDLGIYNSNKKIKNFSLYISFFKVLPILFKVGNLVTPPFLRSLRREISWSIIMKIKALFISNDSRPPLDSVLEQKLKRKFAPEVKKLSNLLGRDLTYWSH